MLSAARTHVGRCKVASILPIVLMAALLATACATATDGSRIHGARIHGAGMHGVGAEAAVQQALKSPKKGAAALSTGRADYWIYGKSVAAELEELMRAIRAAPYLDPDFQPVNLDFRVDGGTGQVHVARPRVGRVVIWERVEVLEIACAAGTLHIERIRWAKDERPCYQTSLIQGQTFLSARWQESARMDRAWKQLESAARRKGNVVPFPGFRETDRPLVSMQEGGIDTRGLSE